MRLLRQHSDQHAKINSRPQSATMLYSMLEKELEDLDQGDAQEMCDSVAIDSDSPISKLVALQRQSCDAPAEMKTIKIPIYLEVPRTWSKTSSTASAQKLLGPSYSLHDMLPAKEPLSKTSSLKPAGACPIFIQLNPQGHLDAFEILYQIIRSPQFTEDGHRGLWGWSLADTQLYSSNNRSGHRTRRVFNALNDSQISADDCEEWAKGVQDDGSGRVLVLRKAATSMSVRNHYHAIDIDGLVALSSSQ